MKSTFLTAKWRKLAIANYAVDPEILRPYLPHKTELDLFNGTCYVSLVGFMFLDTKLKGLAVPFHKNFAEVNLRFYVRHKTSAGWKRGVTFISEIVPKHALTFIANSIYNEKYRTMPMKHEWDINEKQVAVSYSWKYKKIWNNFSITAEPQALEMEPNSIEEFITEHYWGYAQVSKNLTAEYAVEHPRWKTYPVKEYKIEADFAVLYGDAFADLSTQKPASVLLAEGSTIAVLSKNKIV